MEEKKEAAQRHILNMLEAKKLEVHTKYAEVKLKIPRYIKNSTMQQLYDFGGYFDGTTGHIHNPERCDEKLRKRSELESKLRDHIAQKVKLVDEYHQNLKKNLSDELLNTKAEDLTTEEAQQLRLVPIDIQGDSRRLIEVIEESNETLKSKFLKLLDSL